MGMRTDKAADTDVTDAEIEVARARGKTRKTDLFAKRAGYEAKVDRVFIELNNGCRIEVPRRLLQGLAGATTAQLKQVQILDPGTTIAWDDPDVAFSVEGLLQGAFGSKKWMSALGRAGGAVKSPRKAAAARANGTKGGRPRAAI